MWISSAFILKACSFAVLRRKKIKKTEKLKDVGDFLVILISTHARAKMSYWNAMLVERKACWHVANAFSSSLQLIIWPHIQAENVQNVQNLHFWLKGPGVNGLIHKKITLARLACLRLFHVFRFSRYVDESWERYLWLWSCISHNSATGEDKALIQDKVRKWDRV